MPVFTRSVLLGCPIDAAYLFHTDPRNAARVLPPGLHVVSVEASHPASVGDPIKLSLRIMGFLRQEWVVRWKTMIPPQGVSGSRAAVLIDETLQGPFPVFVHEHRLQEEDGLTRLTDHLTFQPPFRPVGWLLLPVIYVQLAVIFWYRHRLTQQVLGR